MKAITLKQPWASMVAFGWKTIETRKWKTRHRGELLIVAGKGWVWLGSTVSRADGWTGIIGDPSTYWYGHAVAVATLIGCRPMTKDDESDALCMYEPGRYAWLLENVRQLETPFRVRGFPGIFEVELPRGGVCFERKLGARRRPPRAK